jgi:hypothetical protein
MLNCNKCKLLKPTTDFYHTGLGKRKYQYSCKLCVTERVKDTYNNKRKPKFKHREDTEYSCIKEDVPRIYFMYADSSIIYIGLSTSFAYRLSQHRLKAPFFKYITHIEVATLSSQVEMALYETILINHHKPKYNKHIYTGTHSFPLPELDFKPWPLN